jgi:hypothetical protein
MDATAKMEPKKMVEALNVYFPSELKQIVGQEADKQDIPMSELVVRIVAKALAPKRPDLAVIPRKRSGRPRKAAEPHPA